MLHIDLTTISYSDNFKLYSSVLRNGANLSSFTSRSDINVCWLPVSNKILTTQIYYSSVTLHLTSGCLFVGRWRYATIILIRIGCSGIGMLRIIFGVTQCGMMISFCFTTKTFYFISTVFLNVSGL